MAYRSSKKSKEVKKVFLPGASFSFQHHRLAIKPSIDLSTLIDLHEHTLHNKGGKK